MCFLMVRPHSSVSSTPGAADTPHHMGPIRLLHHGSCAHGGHLGAPAAVLHTPCPIWVSVLYHPSVILISSAGKVSLSTRFFPQANPNVRCVCSDPFLQQNYPTTAWAASPLRTLCFKLAKSEVEWICQRVN